MKSKFCALPSMQIKDSLSITRKSKATPSSSKSKQTKLPPIAATSKEDQEEWEIKALPSDWEVDKKPSKAIQRLLRKREREHIETIGKMRSEMDEVSGTIEDEIRAASNIYKQRLKEGEKETDECLKNIRQILKGPAVLDATQFTKVVDDIRQIYRLNKNQLLVLMQKLKEREHYRSEAFKKILRRAYTKLNDISYKLPFEIQEYFELEIQTINEIILNNIRSTAELKCHLVLQLKNDVRLALEEVHYIRECWLYYMQLMLFTNLNQNFLNEKECNEEVLNKKAAGTIDSEKSSVNSYWQDETSIDIGKMFNWVLKIERTMNHIDSCAKTLVGSFKEAVIQIARGYYRDMKIAAKKILDLGLAEKSEVHILQSEFCGKVVMDVTEKYRQDMSDIQTMWNNIRSAVQTCLEEALVFLHCFSEVWYAHTGRIYRIQELVMRDVENVMAKHYSLVSIEETKINIRIDTLRQESDEAKLQGLLSDIYRLFDGLNILYNQSYNEECAVIDKVVDFYELEGELFQVELKQFLSQFAMYDSTSFASEGESESNDFVSLSSMDMLELTGAKKLLCTEIHMYRKQIKLLYDWKYGLYKIIHKYADNCVIENRINARDWMSSEHNKARLRLKMILDLFHQPRYGRVKSVILELRLGEIEELDKRFREHQAGLNFEISNTASIYPQYGKQYDEVVERCNSEVEKIKNRVENATRCGTVSSTLTAFKTLLTSCTDKVVEINESYQTTFNAKINRLYLCNLRYAKAIRLFSEGGNFSTEKAEAVCDDLATIERIYKKKVASLAEANAKKCAECLQIFGETKFEITDILTKYEDELRHYDNYTNTLKDVEVQIKEEVYRLKFKSKHVSSNMKALREIGEMFMGQPEKVEYFVQETKKFINLMEEYKEMLTRPTPNAKVCGKLAKTSMLSLASNRSSMHSLGLLKMRTKSTLSLADYSAFMFEVCPEKEENFIGKLRYLLYTSFKNLQKDAKEFYEKHAQEGLISGDKIHANYQDFISDILPKYVYYYLQCELVWLSTANNYIKKVDEVLVYLKRYRNQSIEKYVDVSRQSLQEAFEDILAELDNGKKQSNAEFLAIHKKLKPLHGFPGNKAILDVLDEEMSEFFQTKLNEISTYSYKTKFNDIESKYVVDLFKINDNLEVLENFYEEQELAEDIMDDFSDTLQYLDNFMSTPIELNVNDEALANAFKRLDYYKKTIVIPAEYKLNVSFHTPIYSGLSSAPSDRTLPNVYVVNWIEDYDRRRDDMIDKIDWVIEENKEVIDDWKEIWVKEIGNVINLYKVKYDLPKDT